MAYYSARREAADLVRVAASDLRAALGAVCYETDIAVGILQKLDDFYLSKVVEQRKRGQGNT